LRTGERGRKEAAGFTRVGGAAAKASRAVDVAGREWGRTQLREEGDVGERDKRRAKR
jgi:hypothetical protein